MGVVFRASDTRLHRDVALKLLPDRFAQEPERLSRFQREAQVLASLNHPNIAQIYGLEQVNNSTCIVMELVEGETLEDRLKKGSLSYDDAIDIARQLADALAAAHERGVVHRDLKPANIKLTPSGQVKVLDFGLAKALGPRSSEIHMSAMPTIEGGSMLGTVIGTPGYMSPEQARGKEVDTRTDIWAFGCVLYEMLTARQAFGGETVTDVVAKIVTSPPDLNLLPPDTPPSIRLLLSATLDKNAAHRLQHIGDTRLFLDGPLVEAAKKAGAPAEGRRSSGKLAIATLIAALAVAAIPAALYFRGDASQPTGQMRFEMSFADLVGRPVLSPDGRAIVYAAQPADGRRTLWIRPIDSEVDRQLAGTEDATGVIWAPDSKRILFVAGGRLKKMEIGGPPQVLADIGNIRGASWNNSGVVLLARLSDNVISRVSDTGGEVIPITKLDSSRNEMMHGLPEFLPDGNRFLYVTVAQKPENSGVFLASLDSSEPPKQVLAIQPNGFNGMAYVNPGYLLIHNTGGLTAYRMSADGDRVEGEPVLLAEEVPNSFSVSNNGLLLYRKAVDVAGRQLLWFDRQGKSVGQVGTVANYRNVDLSPNGDRAAVDIIANNDRDIWIIDLERAVPSKVTFAGGIDWTVSWSPDGRRIAFASTRPNAGTQIYEKSSTGAGEETPLAPGELNAIPVHWSPDGRYIVFSRPKPGSGGIYDTWLLPRVGDPKPAPYLETPFDKLQARVSPGGDLIAYSTNESGTYQIVVQTFPDPNGGKWQISAEGGTDPKWRRDGRELYFLALDGKMMSVSISGPDFQAGRPGELFQTSLPVNRAQPVRDRRYDVSPDGRFLIITPVDTTTTVPAAVIVNWTSALQN
jgi:Tol biopolymer transport system component